jgi:hypothetical protein
MTRRLVVGALFSLVMFSAWGVRADSALIIVDRLDQSEDAALELVKATARQTLVSKGWGIIEAFDAKMGVPQMTALSRCMLSADASCIERSVQAAPALSHILVITVKAGGPINGSNTYELIALLSPRSGKPIHTAKRFCERCGAASLENTASELTAEVLLDLSGTGTLEVKSDPPGATIRLDGDPVGVTPITLTTRAGDHVISFELAGHTSPPDVKVAVTAGGMTPVSRTLVPVSGTTDEAKPALAIPISLIALGAAGIGVGTYFILTGGPPGEGDDRKPTQMRVPGIFIAGGGAVVAGVGTYLLVKQLQKKKEKSVAWGATFGPTFVFITGAGHF